SAFGQRQVSTIYDERNQYKVVMGVAPRYAAGPQALKDVYVPARKAAAAAGSVDPGLRDPSTGQPLGDTATVMVPLAAIAHFAERSTPSSVRHQDGELA